MAQARRADELLEHYSDAEFQARFVRCWAARGLLSDCVLADDWEAPDGLADAVVLSAEGTDWAAWLASEGVDWPVATVAVFTSFCRESLFVDIERTNIDSILHDLSDEVRAQRIRIPNAFGRESDDAFGALFGDWRDSLSRDETRRFLKRVPQGVAQLADVVFGPVGVLVSRERRMLDVDRIGAGFYCTDPGCSRLHPVVLDTGRSKPSEALRKLNQKLYDKGHHYSEWAFYFRHVIFPRPVWEFDRFTHGLPQLIANGLSEVERRELLAHLLRSGGAIRSALSDNDYCAPWVEKHADEIVTEVTSTAAEQLILVETDETIVRGIQSLLRSGLIVVPPTERRVSRFTRAFLASGMLDVRPELSALGVRFRPRRRYGLDQLRTFFRELYERSGSTEELDWNVRSVSGECPADRLNGFLLSTAPAEVFRTLVFDSPERLRVAIDLAGPGDYEFPPQGREAEERLIRVLMWKLGLGIDTYPEYLSRFHHRRRRFESSVKHADAAPADESERDEIRGAGSNLFVALEEVLDATLAFSSWALTFDHFGARRNRFQYTLADARRHGFDFINQHADDGTSSLDLSGTNTLGPLGSGFAHLADILRAVGQEESLYRRPVAGLPQWADVSPLEVFPFRHTVPWLDLTAASRSRILLTLEGVPEVLSRNDVARVRNQVTHRRDDFPTGTEVRQVCDALERLVEGLEESGLSPDVYTPQGDRADSYGRKIAMFSDYCGREIELPTPSEIRRSGVPPIARAQAILRATMVEGTSEPLRFAVVEDSDFRQMWVDWPIVVQAPARQPDTARPGGINERGSIDDVESPNAVVDGGVWPTAAGN